MIALSQPNKLQNQKKVQNTYQILETLTSFFDPKTQREFSGDIEGINCIYSSHKLEHKQLQWTCCQIPQKEKATRQWNRDCRVKCEKYLSASIIQRLRQGD